MDEWVAIARVTGARGNRGEVAAVGFGSRPERLRDLRRAVLFGADGGVRPIEIERTWEHRGRLVFKFRGIDSIAAAAELRDAEVRVPLRERPPAPEGEYYHSDLVGCVVVSARTGEELGRVAGLEEFGGPPLLRVEGAGGEVLIPFARSICIEFDWSARRIVVDPPEGLEDLNRG